MKNFFSPVRARLRALFGRSKLDADMAEEMRAHLEMQTEQNVAAGLDAAEAHYAAQRSFGGVEQLKERARAQRGWLWLEHAMQDFRFAVRLLRKSPVFTLVAIVSLAIGIGLNTAVFSIINTIFHQSIRGVPEPRRVLFFNGDRVALPGFERLREEASGVASIVAVRQFEAAMRIGTFERRDRVAIVTPDYFKVLGVQPAVGRLFSAVDKEQRENSEPVAVLSHAFWRRQLGGDPAIIGSLVRLNGVSLTIVGVAAPDFHGPGPEGPPLWVPAGIESSIEARKSAGEPDRLALFGRLKEGVSLPQAQATVDVVVARSPVVFGEKTRFRLSVGREDWRGETSAEKRGEFLLVTTVPLIAVGGLLWIACSNVGNLLLARAVQRRKEIAIRVASGASRGRLVRMMMVESLLLALGGGAAGLWISRVTVDFIFATLSNFTALSVQLDLRVLLYTSAVSVAAALLFGLVPALQASKADVNDALKGESANPAFRSSRLRAFFLVSQIASSVALLVVAGTFVKSLVGAAYVGAQARQMDHLLMAQLSAGGRTGLEREAFFRAAAAKTREVPGIEAATLVDGSNAQRGRFRRPGETAAPSDPAMEVTVQRVDGAFFETVGIRRQRGAPLSAVAPGGELREAIVNEAMARQFWTPDTAIGQRFEIDAHSYVVVGVANDGADRPALYTQLSLTEVARPGLLVRARGKADDFVAPASAALRALMTDFEVPMVNTYRAVAFRTMSELTRLALFIGGLAFTLAVAGIYASMAFSTSQRTREIGVRVALGATRPSVLRLVLASGLRTVGWGSAIGLVLALVGLRLLFGLLGGGSGIDAVAIGAVILFFTAVASLACLLPAYRAAKVDPMVALRTE
jgi:predicted permease